ncbi:MAG: phosphatidylserine decarboxylase, partial [Porticoccaceae bacterium]|nr:phosphatidylserine decarboxylase [Porticoccaceae bacterium]
MSHRADLFVALQRMLPKHGLSRVIAKLAESKRPWLKNKLISAAIKAFDINMAEAATEDLDAYENFNAFFTRELKAGVRPIDTSKTSLISPA